MAGLHANTMTERNMNKSVAIRRNLCSPWSDLLVRNPLFAGLKFTACKPRMRSKRLHCVLFHLVLFSHTVREVHARIRSASDHRREV